MPLILAIDQSTSATKALLYDASGRVVDREALEHRQIYPRPGWVEHDANEIWENTLGALRGLLGRHGDVLGEIACLSLTNQRETVVAFERETGRPLYNAIVWQCRRGQSLCDELNAAGHGEMVEKKTGLKIDTYFSGSKAAWLLRNVPEAAGAVIGTMDAFLIYRLTDGKVLATDSTNASRTLLFDINRLRWDEELCGLFGVPMGALPEVRDSTGRFGETDCGGLLPERVPIRGVMGDSQASLFAHRCFAPGMAKVTIGTGSSILLNIGEAMRGGGEGAVTTVAWTHGGRATYSFEGIINYSAATVAWLKDQLGLIQSAEETEGAALAVGDNGGVYLVPAFAGLGAPHWSSGARAAIVGMSAHTSRDHIIRAALESIAYQIRDALEAMRQSSGVRLATIHADGGATRNRFLMQFIADMTGLEVSAARMSDCSPLGAAMAGMVGMGIHPSLESLAKLPREMDRYSPSMAGDEPDRLHAGWKRAVRQVLAGVE